jgi:hypothetical protein
MLTRIAWPIFCTKSLVHRRDLIERAWARAAIVSSTGCQAIAISKPSSILHLPPIQ